MGDGYVIRQPSASIRCGPHIPGGNVLCAPRALHATMDEVATSLIRITRAPGGWRDLLRAYSILLDGRHVGRIRRGQTKEVAVEPGEHSVQLKCDWCGSQRRVVRLGAAETAEFSCRPGGGFWELWQILTNIDDYIRLTLPTDEITPPRGFWGFALAGQDASSARSLSHLIGACVGGFVGSGVGTLVTVAVIFANAPIPHAFRALSLVASLLVPTAIGAIIGYKWLRPGP